MNAEYVKRSQPQTRHFPMKHNGSLVWNVSAKQEISQKQGARQIIQKQKRKTSQHDRKQHENGSFESELVCWECAELIPSGRFVKLCVNRPVLTSHRES